MVNPTAKDLGLKETVDFSDIIKDALILQGLVIPPPEVVFEIDNIPLLTKQSISLLIAKAKAGKTTVAAWIVAKAILQGLKVLWIDTEQGIYYGSRTQFWVLSIAGIKESDNLKYFDLKAYNPDIRIEVIEQIITEGNFDFIVIDGIRDLVFSINSEEEATIISTKLMGWAKNSNCHLMTILHQNKNDNNARGHIGAELVNKSEATLKITKEDEKVIIEPEFCRDKDFRPFALLRNENGIPHLFDSWEMKEKTINGSKKEKILLPNEIDKSTHLELLQKMFKNESEKKYKAFGISIQNELNTIYSYHIPYSKAENYIQYYLTNELVLIKGKTPQTRYFINPDLLN